jgi:small subunit ribosomal protein S6
MAAETRTYETVCITKVDMPEDKFTALVERVKSAVTNEGKGEWLYSDDWGRAKIAYTIGKDNRGRWTYFRYRSQAAGINEIQRALGINEFVLRSQTVRADENGADFDSIRQNMPQDLQDRERARDWKEERGGYRGRNDRGGYGGRRDHEDGDRHGGLATQTMNVSDEDIAGEEGAEG